MQAHPSLCHFYLCFINKYLCPISSLSDELPELKLNKHPQKKLITLLRVQKTQNQLLAPEGWLELTQETQSTSQALSYLNIQVRFRFSSQQTTFPTAHQQPCHIALLPDVPGEEGDICAIPPA